MFLNIFDALEKSINYTSLTARKFSLSKDDAYFEFTELIENITDNKLKSIEELKESRFIITDINNNLRVMYILLNCPTIEGLDFDITIRHNKEYIIIYRYIDTLEVEDHDVLKRFLLEFEFIINSVFKTDLNSDKDICKTFHNIESLNSKEKIILIAPYVLTAIIFNMSSETHMYRERMMLNDSLNPHDIPKLNDILKQIIWRDLDRNDIRHLFDTNLVLDLLHDWD